MSIVHATLLAGKSQVKALQPLALTVIQYPLFHWMAPAAEVMIGSEAAVPLLPPPK